ncbi:MAG: lamin tail domain-containing protein, partial [Chloroflexi bacterium]|nr:lamin tail domain-containing protein [Chloroflexota bacterium]
GALLDSFTYDTVVRDGSWSRTADGTGEWTLDYPPSPGRSNQPATPTPTATVTPTPTATPTSTPYPLGVMLNEFLPAPRDVDWDGDGTADADDEWIEVFNGSGQTVDLGGFLLDDEAEAGSAPYVIPAGTVIEPGGFLVFFRRDTRLALNNDGDDVRLLGPDGALLDSFTYDTVVRDGSWGRTTDGGGQWTLDYPPSPGRPNQPATPTPTPTSTPTATPYPLGVMLNEFLPAPRDVDWDGDGTADADDEWIEVFNGSGQTVDLGGFLLDDEAEAGSAPYVIPAATIIEPGGFLVFYRRDTGLALNNDGDTARLLGPDGLLLDAFVYGASPGWDIAWSRTVDGHGIWTTDYPPSPGGSNRPPPPTATPTATPTSAPTPTPRPGKPGVDTPIHLSIETARTYPVKTWLTLEGQVTVPPPLFGRSIYIQDHTGGILVYLNRGDYPPLAEGDWLRISGRLTDYHGELEVRVSRPEDMYRTAAGKPVPPRLVRSGEVNEAHEGLLVQVIAPAVRFSGQSFYLDDGSGEARVYVRDSTGFRRPFIHVGEFWSAVGVASQYASNTPYESGYRLLPRHATDLSNAPLTLPVTGGQPP